MMDTTDDNSTPTKSPLQKVQNELGDEWNSPMETPWSPCKLRSGKTIRPQDEIQAAESMVDAILQLNTHQSNKFQDNYMCPADAKQFLNSNSHATQEMMDNTCVQH